MQGPWASRGGVALWSATHISLLFLFLISFFFLFVFSPLELLSLLLLLLRLELDGSWLNVTLDVRSNGRVCKCQTGCLIRCQNESQTRCLSEGMRNIRSDVRIFVDLSNERQDVRRHVRSCIRSYIRGTVRLKSRSNASISVRQSARRHASQDFRKPLCMGRTKQFHSDKTMAWIVQLDLWLKVVYHEHATCMHSYNDYVQTATRFSLAKYMSENMSEYRPWNAMVGITRSKVQQFIFFSLSLAFALFLSLFSLILLLFLLFFLSLSLSLARFFFPFPLSLSFSFACVQWEKNEHDRCWDERNWSHDTHAPGPNFPLPDHDCPWKNTVFEFRSPKFQIRHDTSHSRQFELLVASLIVRHFKAFMPRPTKSLWTNAHRHTIFSDPCHSFCSVRAVPLLLDTDMHTWNLWGGTNRLPFRSALPYRTWIRMKPLLWFAIHGYWTRQPHFDFAWSFENIPWRRSMIFWRNRSQRSCCPKRLPWKSKTTMAKMTNCSCLCTLITGCLRLLCLFHGEVKWLSVRRVKAMSEVLRLIVSRMNRLLDPFSGDLSTPISSMLMLV